MRGPLRPFFMGHTPKVQRRSRLCLGFHDCGISKPFQTDIFQKLVASISEGHVFPPILVVGRQVQPPSVWIFGAEVGWGWGNPGHRIGELRSGWGWGQHLVKNGDFLVKFGENKHPFASCEIGYQVFEHHESLGNWRWWDIEKNVVYSTVVPDEFVWLDGFIRKDWSISRSTIWNVV